MWEAISGWEGWNEVGAAGAWLVTLCLLIIGFAGCFLPVIPGPLLILMAAVFHWFVFREGSGVEWWTFVVLIGLLAASQIFDFVSGAARLGAVFCPLGKTTAFCRPGRVASTGGLNASDQHPSQARSG